jgi:hypothetical protein
MTPSWLPHKWEGKWEKPWQVKPGRLSDVGFKRALRKHGYASPHFRLAEFASKADGCGCGGAGVPRLYRKRTQKLAFKLERVRHAIGNHSIGVLSGYRSSCHNGCVGGASASEHKTGRAIDPIKPGQVSWDKFNDAMEDEFRRYGIGRGCASGNVQHVDTGPERRWCYAGR